MQSEATASGDAAGNGDTGLAAIYGAAAGGQIILSASAGWTGGGGSAAVGVGLKEIGLYELGSQTISSEIFKELELQGLVTDKVALAKLLIKTYGMREVLTKWGELGPGLKPWLKTIPQGPTPAGYAGLALVTHGVLQHNAPDKGSCGN